MSRLDALSFQNASFPSPSWGHIAPARACAIATALGSSASRTSSGLKVAGLKAERAVGARQFAPRVHDVDMRRLLPGAGGDGGILPLGVDDDAARALPAEPVTQQRWTYYSGALARSGAGNDHRMVLRLAADRRAVRLSGIGGEEDFRKRRPSRPPRLPVKARSWGSGTRRTHTYSTRVLTSGSGGGAGFRSCFPPARPGEQ